MKIARLTGVIVLAGRPACTTRQGLKYHERRQKAKAKKISEK